MFGAHLDVAIEGELSWIPEYVDQYLLQPRVVTLDHLRGIHRHWLHQKHICFQSQLHVDQLVDFSDDLADVDWLEVHREFASLKLGEVKRVIDQWEKERRRTVAYVEVEHASRAHVGPHARQTIRDRIDRGA